ncbi:MAG: Hint domain-containing protein, partial [Paracoccus sp.]|nr:Hint domain-containing protein [Paracoccus sp. (in: a-proteobacteria)]
MTYTVLGTPDNGTMWLNGYGNVDYATLTEPRCFTAGTLIEAEAGAVAVENLKVGDRVRTRDHGLKPIRWIETQHLDAQLLAQMPHMRPIRVRAGVLGAGLPRRDLCLSPQHRLVVRNAIVARMFG